MVVTKTISRLLSSLFIFLATARVLVKCPNPTPLVGKKTIECLERSGGCLLEESGVSNSETEVSFPETILYASIGSEIGRNRIFQILE